MLQILRVLSETAVAVRTKAMKCLTAVVESDPGILARVSRYGNNATPISMFLVEYIQI